MPPLSSSRRRERLGLVAVALWVPTVAFLAWQRLAPSTHEVPVEDSRILLELAPDEFATMQRTMRGNVEALHAILEATARSDRPAIADAAREVLRNRPSTETASLKETLPPGWTTLGSTVHRELATLATDVTAGLPMAEVPGRLARVTAACVTCHQTYRYRQAE